MKVKFLDNSNCKIKNFVYLAVCKLFHEAGLEEKAYVGQTTQLSLCTSSVMALEAALQRQYFGINSNVYTVYYFPLNYIIYINY